MTSNRGTLTPLQRTRFNQDLYQHGIYLGAFYRGDKGRSVWEIIEGGFSNRWLTYIPDEEILELGDADSIAAFINLRRCFDHG